MSNLFDQAEIFSEEEIRSWENRSLEEGLPLTSEVSSARVHKILTEEDGNNNSES